MGVGVRAEPREELREELMERGVRGSEWFNGLMEANGRGCV